MYINLGKKIIKTYYNSKILVHTHQYNLKCKDSFPVHKYSKNIPNLL